MCPTDSRRRDPSAQATTILILSADAVAAALLGALIETFGYIVKFARDPESTDAAIRRARPKVCLLDCDDPESCNDEVLGRAAMRGISVVIFGTTLALECVQELTQAHEVEMLRVPPALSELAATLRRAVLRAG